MQRKLSIIIFILNAVQSCFITHFVYYGNLSESDYQRVSSFKYPYIMHLNQAIRFPNNYTLARNLTPVEKSDIKKMQVIYNHGGLYIDNDHLIDMQCIQRIFCPLPAGLYVMDWTDRLGDVWVKSIPISFIYSTAPKNETILKILTSYNQSDKQAVDFSGPFHAQKFRDGFKFVKVNRSCQYHYGMMTWSTGLSMETVWFRRKTEQTKQQIILSQQQQKNKQNKREMFLKLWNAHTVLYPPNFDYKKFIQLDKYFNHVEIIDKDLLLFKVVQYSQIEQTKNKLMKVVSEYQNKLSESTPQLKTQQHYVEPKVWFDLYEIGQFDENADQKAKDNMQLPLILVSVLSVLLVLNIVANIFQKWSQQNSEQKVVYEQVADQSSPKQQHDIHLQNQWAQSQTSVLDRSRKVNTLKDSSLFSIKNKMMSKCILLFMLLGAAMLLILRQQNNSNSELIKKYGITLEKGQRSIQNINLRDYGLENNVQIGSQLDYLNLTSRQEFRAFRQNYFSSLKYSTYTFSTNAALEMEPQMIQYTGNFTDHRMMDKELGSIQKWSKKPKVLNNTQSYLSSYLAYNLEENKTKQIQYYYYNKLYNLDDISQEQPLCVIVAGYQMHTKNKYQGVLESIQKQNYTNYQVIVVDDYSPDYSAKHIYQYLSATKFKLKNRLRIIRNSKKISELGSIYHWLSACKDNSIVVSLSIQAKLIGHQVFKVLNSVYKNQSIWYAHVNYLIQPNLTVRPKIGQYLLSPEINTHQYRSLVDLNKSQMITFRKSVGKKIPIQHLIQYYHNTYSGKLVPKFYYQSAHKILTYSLLELCGNSRYAVVKQPMYLLQQNIYKSCGKQKEKYVEFKSRLKHSMEPLNWIGSQVQYVPTTQYSPELLAKFKSVFSVYQRCLAVFDPPSNLI